MNRIWLIVNPQIVDEHSSRLGIEHELLIPIDANHRDICKFQGPSDPLYTTVLLQIIRCSDFESGASKETDSVSQGRHRSDLSLIPVHGTTSLSRTSRSAGDFPKRTIFHASPAEPSFLWASERVGHDRCLHELSRKRTQLTLAYSSCSRTRWRWVSRRLKAE